MNHLLAKDSLRAIGLILLLLLAWLALVGFVIYPNEFKLQSSVTAGRPRSTTADFLGNPAVLEKPAAEVRLLIGVITRPEFYDRRDLLRLAYGLQPPIANAKIDIRFVFCNITDEVQRVFVAMEIMRQDDIIVLDCKENMNGGKTYTYFSSLPAILSDGDGLPPYDYVMKTDDDAYVRLQRLANALVEAPRKDAYLGAQHPCDDKDEFHFMSGRGYILSWDLVEWISTSEMVKNHSVGYPEDIMTSVWLRDGGRRKNRVDMKPAMYDYMEGPPRLCYQHELVPETIVVHKLKDRRRWARTLRYFNVTRGLKLSKLYPLLD